VDDLLTIHTKNIGWYQGFSVLFNDLTQQLRAGFPQGVDHIADVGAFLKIKRHFPPPGEHPGDAGKLDLDLHGLH